MGSCLGGPCAGLLNPFETTRQPFLESSSMRVHATLAACSVTTDDVFYDEGDRLKVADDRMMEASTAACSRTPSYLTGPIVPLRADNRRRHAGRRRAEWNQGATARTAAGAPPCQSFWPADERAGCMHPDSGWSRRTSPTSRRRSSCHQTWQTFGCPGARCIVQTDSAATY